MITGYLTILLKVMIYLPIFIFSFFSKDFKDRFMKINSNSKKSLIVETIVGINYFLMIFLTLYLSISFRGVLSYLGLIIYFLGLALCYAGYFRFYIEKDSLIKGFPYNISRNPTYFFGFVAVLGIVMLTSSGLLFSLLIIQFLLTHIIISNEEKYCHDKYKKEYLEYSQRVRRYI